jgi:RNA polymerase sigma factor (sigma-70 family)
MGRTSAQLVSQHLHKLAIRYGLALPDHELLQRFILTRDEDAFTALVHRHAAMVMGVCRSILHNSHDAEDIFQAVFLVLARKAASIRKGDSIASYLYAIAYRLARKAHVRDAKRREREQKSALPAAVPMDDRTWGELRGILHEEVNRLPEKYRAAIVLCYWEGQTHEQAAQQLGCARDTVKDRLERARELLRTRLARRGLALTAVWFAAALSGGTSSAAVSTELMRATVRGAILFTTGQLPAGIVSPMAVACARRTLQAMVLGKLKYVLALMLMLGVLGGGAGLAVLREAATPAAPEAPPEQPKAAAPKQEQEHVDFHDDHPLPRGAVARLGTLRFRHSEAITRIAIGTDGTSILSAAGKAVYVWDLATGKERRHFEGHKAPVTSFAISGDGKLLASGCQDGTIHLWDAATGRELHHFTAHKDGASVQGELYGAFVSGFTPDGRQIVSMGSENTIRLWDTASGKKIREFGRFSSVISVSLSPDGKTLAGVVKDDQTWELRLWEVATGQVRKRRPQPGKQILPSAFSPDGKILAVAVGELNGNKPCDIQLWDADASKEIRTLRGHKGWAWFTFAPNGKTLVSWSFTDSLVDGTARLWDVNSGKDIGRIRGDRHGNQFLFCPDGRTLVSYGQNYHTLHFWDRISGKEVRSSGDAITPIDFLSFSSDGRLLATGSKIDWIIRLWDVAARKKVRRLEHGLLTALQFSSDGSQLASASWTGAQVRLWEVAGGKELRRIPSDESDKRIRLMAWSGDGKMLATWTGNQKDHFIHLWNPETGKQLRELNAGMNGIESLVFSPDSKILAVLRNKKLGETEPDHILLWEVDTARRLRTLELPMDPPYFYPGAPSRVAFSPDGRTIAAGGQRAEASICVWELASGRLRSTLKHGEDVACLAFSPDGKLLAAANNLNAYRHVSVDLESRGLKAPLPHVHLWDLAADKEIQVLKGHQGPISALTFSPDGKLLATGSYDTTVLLWDATRFKTNRPAEEQLRPEQIESLWTDLAGTDAVKAYRAIRTLAADPKPSVDFLKRRLKPVAAADAKHVARLLADLDSAEFAAREKAMRELEKLGESAATELHKALAGKPPLEIKRRIEQLLDKANGPEDIRTVRALEALEMMNTREARELCAVLASGVAEARLTREAKATLRRMSR